MCFIAPKVGSAATGKDNTFTDTFLGLLWFSMFNTTNDLKYSWLVKFNQHIKQLRMDGNSKEINLAKPIRELS